MFAAKGLWDDERDPGRTWVVTGMGANAESCEMRVLHRWSRKDHEAPRMPKARGAADRAPGDGLGHQLGSGHRISEGTLLFLVKDGLRTENATAVSARPSQSRFGY